MILLHERMPCSDNFFRYFKNYDKYMDDKTKQQTVYKDSSPKSDNSDGSGGQEFLRTTTGGPKKIPLRGIESPKYGLGLSPIHKFI